MNEAFDNYVTRFDIKDPKIKEKWEHSYRTQKIALKLSSDLALSEEDKSLASIIGLLHDIGRFEQWKNYQTFKDASSFDHGDFACQLLFDEHLIEQYPVDQKSYEIIKKAIRNHNKKEIESGLTDQELLHVKLIRDADKIDILYKNAFLETTYPYLNQDISNEVAQSFWNHELVSNHETKNTNDEIIRLLCFLYDLNFKESLDYIEKENYLKQFEHNLHHGDIFHSYFKELEYYIEKRNR